MWGTRGILVTGGAVGFWGCFAAMTGKGAMSNVSDVSEVVIPICWSPVMVMGKPLAWHRERIPRSVRGEISGPRVYRWTLLDASRHISCAYIGQSERFEERLRAYRKPSSGLEDSELLAAMRKCEQGGGCVELCFLNLDGCALRINGRAVSQVALLEEDVRIMMESIAIVSARVEGVKLLNRLRDNAFVKMMADTVEQYPGVFGPMTPQKRAVFQNLVDRMEEN